jgi:hypothetical protein
MPCSRQLPTSVNSVPVVAVGGTEGLQGMLAAGIHRVVAIYELNHCLSVSPRKRLTVTHIRAGLGQPLAEQKCLLEQTEAKDWSTRQFEDKAADVRQREGDGSGSPPCWLS